MASNLTSVAVLAQLAELPAIPPHVGRRYVQRNGKITGIIIPNQNAVTASSYPFMDPSGGCWLANGKFWWLSTNDDEKDLVLEYTDD